METWRGRWKRCFADKEFIKSFVAGFLMLFASLVVNYYAGIYATEKASNPVTDIILSNIKTVDVDGIFVYGSILLWIFVAYLCIRRPEHVPFLLKSVALFVVIRSVFISLTHIGPFPTVTPLSPENLISYFSFGGDLFFSAHTGLPFLLALLFWENKRLRILFITLAVLFGVVVLLAHLHYSIDVLAAFFITYTIFHISRTIFKKDRRVFLFGPETTEV